MNLALAHNVALCQFDAVDSLIVLSFASVSRHERYLARTSAELGNLAGLLVSQQTWGTLMSDDKVSPTGLQMKVDLGIAELVDKIAKIFKRRRERKDRKSVDYFSDLQDDLESVNEVIRGLDQMFVDLATGFTDEHIVNDAQELGAHVQATRKYLDDRKIVPKLPILKGRIRGASEDKRVTTRNQPLADKLGLLVQNIDTYLMRINYTGPSGVGHKELRELCKRSKEKLGGKNILANDIIQLAQNALSYHSHKPSIDIQELTGEIQSTVR